MIKFISLFILFTNITDSLHSMKRNSSDYRTRSSSLSVNRSCGDYRDRSSSGLSGPLKFEGDLEKLGAVVKKACNIFQQFSIQKQYENMIIDIYIDDDKSKNHIKHLSKYMLNQTNILCEYINTDTYHFNKKLQNCIAFPIKFLQKDVCCIENSIKEILKNRINDMLPIFKKDNQIKDNIKEILLPILKEDTQRDKYIAKYISSINLKNVYFFFNYNAERKTMSGPVLALPSTTGWLYFDLLPTTDPVISSKKSTVDSSPASKTKPVIGLRSVTPQKLFDDIVMQNGSDLYFENMCKIKTHNLEYYVNNEDIPTLNDILNKQSNEEMSVYIKEKQELMKYTLSQENIFRKGNVIEIKLGDIVSIVTI